MHLYTYISLSLSLEIIVTGTRFREPSHFDPVDEFHAASISALNGNWPMKKSWYIFFSHVLEMVGNYFWNEYIRL